jgi:hypothetical protein
MMGIDHQVTFPASLWWALEAAGWPTGGKQVGLVVPYHAKSCIAMRGQCIECVLGIQGDIPL